MNNKRWIYAILGVGILLFSGMVYAWSVLSRPIAADFADWTKAQLSLTFTIVMIMFCIGCLTGGLLAAKVKANVCILISAVLFLAGFWIASLTQSSGLLYLGFGVICGFASGFSYNAVMGNVGKWFPDRPGMISGILLMGFGISSFLIGKVFQAITPEVTGAWRTSFRYLGIAAAIVLTFCGLFIRKPNEEESRELALFVKTKKSGRAGADYSAAEMMKDPTFWIYFVWVVLLSAAGLALTSQAGGIAVEVEPSITAGSIATLVGMISIANGISRIIMGSMYDKVGRSFVMQAVNILFIIAGIVLIFAIKNHSITLVTAGFLIGGAAYGGVTPTNSAFISSYYGQKNYPVNFSIINTNLIIASFGSTVAGALYDGYRSYLSTDIMIILLAALGIAASFAISMLDKKGNFHGGVK